MQTKIRLPRQYGFSLIEMLIVLLIVGVLAIGTLFGVAEFRSSQDVDEGEEKIYNIKAQLLSFAQVNKFLPCPDTDYDGFENRTNATPESPCTKELGTAPYIDLGLPREGVQDAWGNFIRYAVNRNVESSVFICDRNNSASYFCKSGFGTNWFTLTETPPLSGVRGGGNYYVCKSSACNTTPSNLEVESASIVLVAYNKDGQETLGNCSASIGASLENCNVDDFYQNGIKSSEDGSFYDDVVLTISGYEIKKALLGKTIVWDAFPAGSNSQLTPTYEDFDITSTDDQGEISTVGDDIVFTRRNVDTALDLGTGDDYIAIGNDLNSGATLNTGIGNDTVYIVGLANSAVLLGAGDDVFVLANDLTNTLNADTGNDKVWIQGGVTSTATFTLGSGDDVVWLGRSSDTALPVLDASVNGDTGYDILILENMTKTEWDAGSTAFRGNVVGFELVLFEADAAGAREYVELP